MSRMNRLTALFLAGVGLFPAIVQAEAPRTGSNGATVLGYSPLDKASEKSRLDGVFANTLFWVITRSINCTYCMGHCEMLLEVAGLPKPEIARRTMILAGDDWSSFSPEEQRAFAFARKLTKAPWTVATDDIDSLKRDFESERALTVIYNACWGNYMTRVSNGFQLRLERENIFFDSFSQEPAGVRPATGTSAK
jgi:alkylhydroperoxidase family enzyme